MSARMQRAIGYVQRTTGDVVLFAWKGVDAQEIHFVSTDHCQKRHKSALQEHGNEGIPDTARGQLHGKHADKHKYPIPNGQPSIQLAE